jgi:hypothetical protein
MDKFDLSDAVKKLEQVFPEVTFISYGGFIPVQAFGMFKDKYFYFRFRGGEASLTVGDEKDGEYVSEGEIFYYDEGRFDSLEGVLDSDEFYDVMLSLFKKVLRNIFEGTHD